MPKPSPKKKPDSLKLEFAPDAWERFSSMVWAAAKIGDQPHKATSTQPKKAVKSKAKKKAAK